MTGNNIREKDIIKKNNNILQLIYNNMEQGE